MATGLTKKQKEALTDKITGLIRSGPALRMTTDSSVNEMNINQISRELNRIHYRAIGKDLPAEINIPVKQLGSGDPAPDNIRPIVGYEIDGIGTIYGGELNIDTGVLIVNMQHCLFSELSWTYYSQQRYFYAIPPDRFANYENGIGFCSMYQFWGTRPANNFASDNFPDKSFGFPTTAGQKYVYIKELDAVDVTAFRAISDNAELVYTITTPQSYTLTPQQMLQLLDQL